MPIVHGMADALHKGVRSRTFSRPQFGTGPLAVRRLAAPKIQRITNGTQGNIKGAGCGPAKQIHFGDLSRLQAVVGSHNLGLPMTIETRTILRELAIVQTTLNNVMKQTDGLVRHSLKDVTPKTSKPYSDTQLKETISQMQKRLQEVGITDKI
jgi:hypothetical protein